MSMKFILILITILAFPVHANQKAKLDDIFRNKTSIKNPFSLRDPFQSPKFKSATNRSRIDRTNGVLDNIPTYNEAFDVNKVIVVGVLIGKERRVVIKFGSDRGGQETSMFTYREGDRIGNDGPEIKAILPGGIILVEQITNVYGQK